ncbi:hypothetical protein Y032_1281g3805 [Ancylostoma ceylanicum]|uniref:Uncharacterized protein n=1 Tax=Ancylostoma ceylanicum TaxID=53326 RepID=A0A016W6I5_9BILA|nr:hypothetical protein Y032_1281g3805 [Ancylostoma ceylanicum]
MSDKKLLKAKKKYLSAFTFPSCLDYIDDEQNEKENQEDRGKPNKNGEIPGGNEVCNPYIIRRLRAGKMPQRRAAASRQSCAAAAWRCLPASAAADVRTAVTARIHILAVTTVQRPAVAESATPRHPVAKATVATWLAKGNVVATQHRYDWVAWQVRGSFCHRRRLDRGDRENM